MVPILLYGSENWIITESYENVGVSYGSCPVCLCVILPSSVRAYTGVSQFIRTNVCVRLANSCITY